MRSLKIRCGLKSQAIASFVQGIREFSLRVKKSHLRRVCNHKGKLEMMGKPHVAKTCATEAAYNKYQQPVVKNSLK